jgi:iron complex transport system ATP-binding protein
MARFSHERTDLARNQSSLHFIEPILNQTGLREIAHRPISSLSGGERQRANIAAALAQDAPMLALDEPYAHLDPAQQASIHSLLKEISTQKKLSLLIATHDLNWISEHCERIIALKNGKIIFDQSPDFILKKPILEEIFETKFLITQHPEKKYPLILSNP